MLQAVHAHRAAEAEQADFTRLWQDTSLQSTPHPHPGSVRCAEYFATSMRKSLIGVLDGQNSEVTCSGYRLGILRS
jgi:hypothetical protein